MLEPILEEDLHRHTPSTESAFTIEGFNLIPQGEIVKRLGLTDYSVTDPLIQSINNSFWYHT